MKVIFHKLTQIGLCTAEAGEDGTYRHALFVPWPILAETQAAVDASTLTLNISHKCYLELNGYRVGQPWITPHQIGHTIFSSEHEMAGWAEDLHRQFIVKAGNHCPEQFVDWDVVRAAAAPKEPVSLLQRLLGSRR